jgi:hypothetical protein
MYTSKKEAVMSVQLPVIYPPPERRRWQQAIAQAALQKGCVNAGGRPPSALTPPLAHRASPLSYRGKAMSLIRQLPATRGHGGEVVKSAEASAIPISIPTSPTISIDRAAYMTAAETDYTDAVLIGSRLSLRGHCRGSDAEQRRGNDQPVPGQHGLYS